MWNKWLTCTSLWAKILYSTSVEKSFQMTCLLSMNDLMLAHTHVWVEDGSSLFLSINWSGQGSLIDLFDVDSSLLQNLFKDV